ncbi:guanylate-binding protein 5 isoform X3 [Ovis aries]|uniref:guanylate-binding protein 5 isoform X3 n=1 Tax=Ovis aries TaxID=9940 RepID=UPI0029528C66|nr:guanylate-binding protein 5 isoform X3 [Ovis aries]
MDMAPLIHMPEPLCLIENTNGPLLVNPEALKILSDIRQPVVVVAIMGLNRTGKSYLINKLAGKNKGFSVGSTVQSHTKGIWMWCVPHPKKPNHTLVLLDTEGLGDVEKGDKTNDTHIAVLALLLSSTFVYNTMNKIDQGAIDLLHYVTELSHLLRIDTSPNLNRVDDTADFVRICPDLVWTLRDFYLDLEANGQLITADEYLENSLRPKQGPNQHLQNFNLPRLCIQKFFPVKKCFIFDLPTHQKKLAQLETLHNDDLDPKFVQQVAEFCSYVFSHSKTKTLSGGIKASGSHLENLVQTYVNAINSGNLPCMESEVLTLARIKNSVAVQKAIAHYDQEMGQKLQLPTETLQELLDLHRASEKETIEVFMKNSFKDEDQGYQKKLEAEEALQKYLESKESVSVTIFQIDLALTAREKEIEGITEEFMKAEARRLMESLTQHQQMMEQRKIFHQEQVRLMERNRVYQQALQQRAMEGQLQEEVKRLKEIIQAENRKLHDKLQNLLRNDSPDDACILL